MSKPIDFDAAIRKNAALEMAHQRATNQAQAAELRAKDAEIAVLREELAGARDELSSANTVIATALRFMKKVEEENSDLEREADLLRGQVASAVALLERSRYELSTELTNRITAFLAELKGKKL